MGVYSSKHKGKQVDDAISQVQKIMPERFSVIEEEILKLSKNKADINSVPKNTSDINNDSGFVSESSLNKSLTGMNAKIESNAMSIAEHDEQIGDISTSVAELKEGVSRIAVLEGDVISLGEGHDSQEEKISAHVNDADNPHNVTAEQVGAYTKEETAEILNGKVDVLHCEKEGKTYLYAYDDVGLMGIETVSNADESWGGVFIPSCQAVDERISQAIQGAILDSWEAAI